MSKRISGITIEIDGDARKFTKELNEVEKAATNTQRELKDINRLLKMDPGNADLIAQKQRALADAIGETKEKLRLLKEASQQADQALANGTMSQTQYDALQREIIETEQDLRSLEDQARQTGNAMSESFKQAGDKMQKVGDKVTSVGDQMTQKVTLPIIGVGTAVVKIASDFEAEMSKVQAISGATGEDMEKLRAKAREMGESTKFSATEAAEGMEYMAMAGWKTEDMLNGLDGILHLAAASGEELGTTSDIVTDALTAFGMEAGEAGHFSDILASASSNANTNVSLMGETFKYVAPVMGSMGYSAEDAALAIGLMANAGIKGSQSGTALRSVITRLSAPTDAVASAMTTLGISLTDAYGNTLPFRDVMEQLRSAFANGALTQEEYSNKLKKINEELESGDLVLGSYEQAMQELNDKYSEGGMTTTEYNEGLEAIERSLTIGDLEMGSYQEALDNLNIAMYGAADAQQAQLAAAIAGKYGMSGFMAVVNASEDDWNKLSAAIDGCSDEMVRTADGSVMSLKDAMASGAEITERYNGAAEAMAATMQDNLQGDITTLISKLQELAISFGDILIPVLRDLVDELKGITDTFNGLDDETKEMIVRAAAVAAALGPILSIGGRIISGTGMIVSGIGNLTATLGGATVAAEGTAAAGASASGALAGIGAAAGPIAAIVGIIVGVVAAIMTLWQTSDGFREAIMSTCQQITTSVSEFVSHLLERFQAVTDAISGIEEKTQLFSTAWDIVCHHVGAIAEFAFGQMGIAIEAVTGILTGVIDFLTGVFTLDFDTALKGILEIVTSTFDFIAQTVINAINSISTFLSNSHWELPKIKIPHISIEGNFSLNPPSVPHFNIEWYKKAYDDAMILSNPTIFGAMGGKLLGGGDGSGSETVVGTEKLMSMIGDVVAASGGDTIIPVYIGTELIDEMVVKAGDRVAYRSGGR